MSREDPNVVLNSAAALMAGPSGPTKPRPTRGERRGTTESNATVMQNLQQTVDLCAAMRKRRRPDNNEPDLSDAGLSKLARFSDALDLHRYSRFVHLIPRIVNVVRWLMACCHAHGPTLSSPCAGLTRRGRARARHQHRAAAQPPPGCESFDQRLLRTKAFCSGADELLLSTQSRSSLSHRSSCWHRCAHHPLVNVL